MTGEILRAALEDAEEILVLQKLAYRSEAEIYQDFNIPPLKQSLEEIMMEFDGHVFLIAVSEERIVGSVRACERDGTCFIGKLIVHPDCQNRGIGSRLMRAIENEFRGASRFELFTGFKSEKNIHLYQKLGYHIFKTTPVSERLNFVFMEKSTSSNTGFTS